MSERKSLWELCLHAKSECLKRLAAIFAMILAILGAGIGAEKLRASGTRAAELETSAEVSALSEATMEPQTTPSVRASTLSTNQILTPEDFQFLPEELPLHQVANNENDAIFQGVSGAGQAWITSALAYLGFSTEQIKHHLDGAGGKYVMGSAEIDRYLTDVRRGSWGTTLFVRQEGKIELIPAFHSSKFASSPNGERILRETAAEETVQGMLYTTIFELQSQDSEEWKAWGFPSQESLVESFSDGSLRAFFEYAQHEALLLTYPDWRNVSYSFQIGVSSGELPQVRSQATGLVNTVMGTNYTRTEEILPYFGDREKLLQLNRAFRRWSGRELGHEYNVWDAFGISRRGQAINIPLAEFDFANH